CQCLSHQHCPPERMGRKRPSTRLRNRARLRLRLPTRPTSRQRQLTFPPLRSAAVEGATASPHFQFTCHGPQQRAIQAMTRSVPGEEEKPRQRKDTNKLRVRCV